MVFMCERSFLWLECELEGRMIMLFSRSRYDIILDLHFWKQLVLFFFLNLLWRWMFIYCSFYYKYYRYKYNKIVMNIIWNMMSIYGQLIKISPVLWNIINMLLLNLFKNRNYAITKCKTRYCNLEFKRIL